eukprot:scaffold13059_cov62-Phaeocystis_antarctica.AAC.3
MKPSDVSKPREVGYCQARVSPRCHFPTWCVEYPASRISWLSIRTSWGTRWPASWKPRCGIRPVMSEARLGAHQGKV